MPDAISPKKCPRCGAQATTESTAGLCPACLLKQVALGTSADSLPAEPWTPPALVDLSAAFPQLEIIELIGRGGMGAVYKARQKSLGRLIALKILAPAHATRPSFAERFSREAQALAELNHPHIVTVHDFGRSWHVQRWKDSSSFSIQYQQPENTCNNSWLSIVRFVR